jgi:hypothetical protein
VPAYSRSWSRSTRSIRCQARRGAVRCVDCSLSPPLRCLLSRRKRLPTPKLKRADGRGLSQSFVRRRFAAFGSELTRTSVAGTSKSSSAVTRAKSAERGSARAKTHPRTPRAPSSTPSADRGRPHRTAAHREIVQSSRGQSSRGEGDVRRNAARRGNPPQDIRSPIASLRGSAIGDGAAAFCDLQEATDRAYYDHLAPFPKATVLGYF